MDERSIVMVKLTFYGGIREIGGNKVLLEDGKRRLFLDFGYPYSKYRNFYEEYLKPRAGAGLLDLLVMKLLPPLEGVYRDDLETPDLWQQFHQVEHYRRLEGVDGILLSHAHLDHSGHISFLKEDIPVYSTATTAFIAKAIQDSGKVDFDQQVCYFSPTVQKCPAEGWKQIAYLAGNSEKHQRHFRIADVKPEMLTTDVTKFWLQGFWRKTARQKELISHPLEEHVRCSFNLRCFPVDHSIPGACAWGIETSSGWVIYSGDLRLHGKRGKLTEAFIEEAAQLHPKTLILEGTNVDKPTNVAEQEVYENAFKAINDAAGLVIADFSARDVDRLLTFLQIARDTKRKLAILPKDAYLLKTMRLLEPQIPDIAQENALVIYQETTASRSPAWWLRNIYQEYSSKIILAKDVVSNQGDFILCFSFFDLNELPSIRPRTDSLYVYSSSEPHSEEQEMDFWRLHHWLERFEIRGFGLPVEKNGKWEIPEDQKGLHASGHACAPDLLKVASEIRPELLIPVHCEKPDFYVDNLSGSGIEVKLPSEGKTIEI
ncbi:MAG: exonuclease [Chloroflexi bacterium CG_4_9_14_3_um_filter_45_9]|nr:MAG: exonuclease [Chloroflexi bacterium CG_4_9_14_3_um_filter_45_9]